MSELFVYLVLMIIVTGFLVSTLKIAQESERFAVFVLGRFHSFKGPGLILITPYTQQVHRLKVGDVGVLTSPEFARFDTIDIPVSNVGSLRQGQAVRIEGFDGVEPRIVASSVPAPTICPSCGHKF